MLITPTNEFLRMPSRRNPNSVLQQMDQDTVDFKRSSSARQRLSAIADRLLDDRQRTIGMDIRGLNEQMNDKSTRLNKFELEKRDDSRDVENSFRDYRESQRLAESNSRREAQRYAAILKYQCLERQTKSYDQPDFDPKYLIGFQKHPRDDLHARRQLLMDYQKELRMQIETKLHDDSKLEIPPTPLYESRKLDEYRERLNQDFINGNRAIMDQKRPKCREHVGLDTVTLPESMPHSKSTDFKGYSSECTRQLLEENERLIASKNASQHALELSDLSSRIEIERAAKNEELLAQQVRNNQREAQKQCLSISTLNTQLRDQTTKPQSVNEYFTNRFGNSLIYSLLE